MDRATAWRAASAALAAAQDALERDPSKQNKLSVRHAALVEQAARDAYEETLDDSQPGPA